MCILCLFFFYLYLWTKSFTPFTSPSIHKKTCHKLEESVQFDLKGNIIHMVISFVGNRLNVIGRCILIHKHCKIKVSFLILYST